MHEWGDGFKYFDDVDKAAFEIGQYCRRYGRIHVSQTKEKYGEARVYCSFGIYDLHNIIYPGFAFNHFGKILTYINYNIVRPLFDFEFLQNIVVKYQIKIYRKAYLNTIKKYPHIEKEILSGMDYPEYYYNY